MASLLSLLEKDLHTIHKFDGTNFAMWKEQIQDVVVQRNQPARLLERDENDGLSNAQWLADT